MSKGKNTIIILKGVKYGNESQKNESIWSQKDERWWNGYETKEDAWWWNGKKMRGGGMAKKMRGGGMAMKKMKKGGKA